MTRFGRTIKISARTSTFLAHLALAAMLGGCSAGPGSGKAAKAPATAPVVVAGTELETDRVYALQGHPAVVPLTPGEDDRRTAGTNWTPSKLPIVMLEGGKTLDPRVYRITGRIQADALEKQSWLPPRLSWNSEPFDPLSALPGVAPGDAAGPIWLLVVDMPSGIDQRELPRFMRIDGRAVSLTWLQPPPTTVDGAMCPHLRTTPAALRALGELLRPALSDPLERWRAHFLAERFGAAALWGEEHPPEAPLAEPLEVTAWQIELGCRTALDNLRRIDRNLAGEVLTRLTSVIRAPDGSLLPAWSPGDPDTSAMMRTLLDPRPLRAERTSAARLWLDKQPIASAWIVDDIGAPGRSGSDPASTPNSFRPTVGIADLTGKGGRARVAAITSSESTGTDLGPCDFAFITAPLPLGVSSSPTITAQFAQFSSDLHPISGVLPVAPPGTRLGPLLTPWTLNTWPTRLALPAPPQRTASVLVQRAPSSNTTAGGWELFIECPIAEEEINAADTIRIWCGPFNATRAVIEATPRAATIREGAAGTSSPIAATLTREQARWTALITLPPSTFEPGGILILGLERENPPGARATFPRPLMPGQSEPGRIAVDLNQWGSLGQR